ncbi:hypothetical protein PBI_DAMIEN_73 [Mycobacterium phage Damien]|uniref:hypothetical protein n=1 Tax=Mycobacterium phage Damien TaxID=1486469 RepID=UPI00045F74BF|nr:hypothetical protein HL12_gp73 [Mycobacterium phage Damien]AHZ95434.1 hypothetical protein PBI_DAMIEN_73 [Mycobacterium phage Damien]QDH84936.1 hypothetical protein SEA_Phreeze_72 [Mycobacterium phage Phreeze]
MPTLSFGFNDVSDEISEGFSDYDGPLPPNGSYTGTLKVAKVVAMKKDPSKRRISLLVVIDHPDYKGYPAWGGVNLTEQGIPYVNQWLRSLVSSEEEFKKIHKVFFGKGPVVDEKKENILKIGTVKINSPEGELKVKVTLKQRTWEGKTTAGVQAFLSNDDDGGSSDDEVVEEETEDPDLDTEADDDEDAEPADESIFDEEEETEED